MTSTTILYVKLGILVVGLLFTAVGGCQLVRQYTAPPMEVEPVDLAKLEAGERPQTRFVRIEEYVARDDHAFIETVTTSTGRFSSRSVTNTRAYYPIVSKENAAADVEIPLSQFVVVVMPLNTRFDKEGGLIIPRGPLEGAIAIGVDALESDEIDFLEQEFPTLKASRVMVLIPGEKPWVSVGWWMILAFGLVVLIAAATTLMSGGE